MYELIRVSEHDYYIDCPAKIGVIRTADDGAVLIDSGSDKDAGKKVFRVLEANGWKLRAIFNTHSHADHTGGNRFLQDKTGCPVYARDVEADITNHPILEPAGLYGGFPMKELRHKFLMAQESRALPLTEDVLPEGMELLLLPGHSFDMVGFRTADGNVFPADSVSSAETLEKYGIGYLWDVEASLQTLTFLQTLEAKSFIPSHAPVTDSIAALAQLNENAIRKAADTILDICRTPCTMEILLKRVFEAFGLTMNMQQYALIGSTVRSYLSWLAGQGRVSFRFENNEMLWETVL